jgi:5,10-methylenetetrahydrofolate reductase
MSAGMGFLRVVEVFPPLFPTSRRKEDRIDFEQGLERFIDKARSARAYADVLLVADVKNTKLLKFSTLEAAALLKERLRVEVAPVLVTRDFNRPQFLSIVLTGLSLELDYLMFAWGDTYPAAACATNVRDFRSLAEVIQEASLLRRRARAATRFLAPVDVEGLAEPGEAARARERLRAGADYLLAQPPTTDTEALDRHGTLLREAKLEDRILLNVFPFRDLKDVRECEAYFGWQLPKSLHSAAAKGEKALFEAEREVVATLRDRGFPGVYLNTRGRPTVAERLLS